MGSFCLVVELHQEGSAINGATPSSLGSVVTTSRQVAAEERTTAIFNVLYNHSDYNLLNTRKFNKSCVFFPLRCLKDQVSG